MFLLTVIEDKVKIAPEQFDSDITDALVEQIEDKFCDKVLLDVGHCVAFYDFLEVGNPYVYPAEGSCHQLVTFRLVVFKPFVGEIISGRIVSASATEGLKISVRFFDDIVVPPHLMPSPSEFDELRGVWLWRYCDDASEDVDPFEMNIGDEVRFKVRAINFTRLMSTAKGLQATTTSESQSQSRSASTHQSNNRALADPISLGRDDSNQAAPRLRRRSSSSLGLSEESVPAVMSIIACLNEDGLGLVDWWNSGE
jgi:DNA-directed RNA polymerase III subunit RPC8